MAKYEKPEQLPGFKDRRYDRNLRRAAARACRRLNQERAKTEDIRWINLPDGVRQTLDAIAAHTKDEGNK